MAKLVYLIEQAGTEGLPTFYAPAQGRNTGHGINGWTQDKEAALGFATGQDAQTFIDALMPRQGESLRPVPYTRRGGA